MCTAINKPGHLQHSIEQVAYVEGVMLKFKWYVNNESFAKIGKSNFPMCNFPYFYYRSFEVRLK